MTVSRALISVFDKDKVDAFARNLAELGVEIVSSSGTAKFLEKAGLEVREVSDLTGYPHLLGGRVKTLHPAVMGGILARRHLEGDLKDAETYNIPLIDLVVCNLYPFEETARRGADLGELLENIDIGGVTLIRAAAKNFKQVVVITDPADYDQVVEEIHAEGDVTLPTRERLALKAFAYTSLYDATIHRGLSASVGVERELEPHLLFNLSRERELRYGENPFQKAALYLPPLSELPWELLSGKPLSYNNILDLDGALRGCALFQSDCACVINKHTTPCGLAVGMTPIEAYRKALACDPVSAFGGIVGFTRKVDLETAQEVAKTFTEVLVAPDFSEETVAFFAEKKPNVRILRWKGGRVLQQQITGTWSGILVQEDNLAPLPSPDKGEWVGTARPDLWDDLMVAWKACYLSKSNAIIFVKDGATVGIGRGFTSRVDAAEWAAHQAGEKANGAVLASDAFFPFPDSIEKAAEAGIAAIIQPGGSIRDKEVFSAARDKGISMFISGWRTFRH